MMMEIMINETAKIIVNEKEVYYGEIIEHDEKNNLYKLKVVDWRNRYNYLKQNYIMIVPTNITTIKYISNWIN